MRRTKIVCTLGPATNDVEIMKDLIRSGLDGARINFSHGTYESHTEIINKLKQAREELNAPIPLILDTKGPEIRLKTFDAEKYYLEKNAKFTLTTEDIVGNQEKVAVTYQDLPNDLEVGSRVLIDDGLIELRVDSIKGNDINCTVVNGGFVSSNKGMNLPDVYVHLPSLTERDIEDIKFGIEMGFDYIAASFIRTAKDVINIRKVLEENGGNDIHIIAKIESREGVINIDEILEVADSIMVARGDLGVEIPSEEVPLVQKSLIEKANAASKPVITATQMLESMIANPRPTRAEANDVANTIFDGSDAIMLSGETAKGDYPVEAVAMMAKIAEKTEHSINYSHNLTRTFGTAKNITNAISYAACTTAAELKTACICTVTTSGFTARMIAKHRPTCPIVGCTMNERAWRQMNLVWGCKSLYHERPKDDEIFDVAIDAAVKSGLAKNGDTIVIAVGVPLGVTGSTNTLRVDVIGDVLAKGIGFGKERVSGTARVIKVLNEAEIHFRKGDILVTTTTDSDWLPYIKKASAVIVGPIDPDHIGSCHAEHVCRALNIPMIACNMKVIDFMPNDGLITVDPKRGYIYTGIPEQD